LYFNHSFGGDTTPNPAVIAAFPELAYDSYVSTTAGFAQLPAIPGPPGPPDAPPVFRGQVMDAAWGATPNTGPLNGQSLEIARASIPSGVIPILNPAGGFGVSAVFSSDEPNIPVPIPPIPEPAASTLIAGLALTACRRGRVCVRHKSPLPQNLILNRLPHDLGRWFVAGEGGEDDAAAHDGRAGGVAGGGDRFLSHIRRDAGAGRVGRVVERDGVDHPKLAGGGGWRCRIHGCVSLVEQRISPNGVYDDGEESAALFL
jgi:hypothetical protein